MVAAQALQTFLSDRNRKLLELKGGDQVMVHREFFLTPEPRNCPALRQAGPSLVWPILCHREDHRKHFPPDFPRQLKCHCPVFDIMASLVLFWQCHTLVFHFSSIVAAFILTPD